MRYFLTIAMVDEHCVVISEVLTQFLSRITVSLYFCPRILTAFSLPSSPHSQANCTSATVNKTVELRALFIVNDSFS